MTYCLSIHCNDGLVLCSDSRTPAGSDQWAQYSKMHRFVWPGNRLITLLSAGNLAVTQAVMNRINHDLQHQAAQHLLSLPSLHEIAEYVAVISAETQKSMIKRGAPRKSFEATFIVAGQIGQAAMETILIYPQGNFISQSDYYPFLQIGETKYGKPILDRVIKADIALEVAARCALVSMNSTMRSNKTVGPPIELLIYRKNDLKMSIYMTLTSTDPLASQLAEVWNKGLTQTLEQLPKFPWEL